MGADKKNTKSLAEKGIRVSGVAPGLVWPLVPVSFSPDKVDEFGEDTVIGHVTQPFEIALDGAASERKRCY